MVYAHADGATIAKAVESAAAQVGSSPSSEAKRWKGKEQYLLELCGLA